MSHAHPHTQIPRGVLLAAGALVAFSIVVAAVGRLTGVGTVELPPGVAVVERALRFEDDPLGGVRVLDDHTGAGVEHIVPGEDGFVRGVLRGFARARRLHGVGTASPMVLTRWADGRLTLSDPSTGHVVALEAFGPDNARAFARLLPALRGGDARIDPISMYSQSASRRGEHHDRHRHDG